MPRLHALLVGLALASLASAAEPIIADLRIEQPIAAEDHRFTVTPRLRIAFVLAAPAEPTVTIARHLAGYYEHTWPWLAHPIPVRVLKPGRLAAGPHALEWDGLDAQGHPVVEVRNTRPDELERRGLHTATLAELTTTTPVDRIAVTVEAGGVRLSANLTRAVGSLRPDRLTLPFRSAFLDREGRYLVSDFIAGSVLRYSADWILEREWPRFRRGQGADPDECSEAAADSAGNVYAMNTSGIYRFGADADGDYAPWPVRSDYMRDQAFGHKLGVKTDDPELGRKPGFAREFSGFTIDDHDQLYLGRRRPDPCIMVFNTDGRYLRSLPMPEGRFPGNIRSLGKGVLAVTAIGSDPEGILVLLDADTGAVRKRIAENNPLVAFAGPDGSVYAGHTLGDLRRYDRAGDPWPFASGLPWAKGNELRFYPHEIGWPKDAIGFPFAGRGFAIGRDGAFAISGGTDDNDRSTRTELTRYAADGTFVPEDIQVEFGEQVHGNVFVDDQPATFALFVTSLAQQEEHLSVAWTTHDFDGTAASGSVVLAVRPLARQSLRFTIPAPALGHYRLILDVSRDGRRIEHLETQCARIASRPLTADRWSPFAFCGAGEFELLALAGGKCSRGDTASWARQVEPLPGVFYPEHPEAVQFGHSGLDSLRQRARDNGFLLLNGLDYGEGWLGGDWTGSPQHFLYSYDRFYGYCLHVLDCFAGKGEAFYQFWNEPNFFWHPRDTPFGLEHFAIVQQHVWSMVKARDKDALAIADGDAGSTAMMQHLADLGAADWNDGVEMHYPATQALAFDNMRFTDLPEAKVAAVEKLVAIRDRDFPGKPVWNTEDAVPADPPNATDIAVNLPRLYIPQIAAGVDRIFWFACPTDVTGILDGDGHPWPAYAAYATMTRMLAGSTYAGQAEFAKDARGYLFTCGSTRILAANALVGEAMAEIEVGAPEATVIDLMGRQRTLPAPGGRLAWHLTPRMQYLQLPRASATASRIAGGELRRRLEALQIADAPAIAAAIEPTARAAVADREAMLRLHRLVQAAEIAAITSQAPPAAAGQVPGARAAVVAREGADGYLRQSRIALDWAERLAQAEVRDPAMAWPAGLAARATRALAATEAPMLPGVMIDAWIGEPGEIARIRATVPEPNRPETAIDAQFRCQIAAAAGGTCELELTVRDVYRHPISGILAPRLPQGWAATPATIDIALQPGELRRQVFTVRIPADAKPGVHRLGGAMSYQGATVVELHPMRVAL